MISDLLLILALFLVIIYFWQLRQMAELSHHFIQQACIKQNVQLISTALKTAKPMLGGQSGISWKATYLFEFSTDGLNKYKGYLWMQSKTVVKIEWPIFPEPEWEHSPQKISPCKGKNH